MREFDETAEDISLAGPRMRRVSLRVSHLLLPAGILATAALAALVILDPYGPPANTLATAPEPRPAARPTPGAYANLLDPGYQLGIAPRTLDRASQPVATDLRPAAPTPAAPPSAAVASVASEPLPQPQIALPPIPGERPQVVDMIPLPVPRPSDLRIPAAPERPRLANPQPQRRTKSAAAPSAPEDNRNFFEKLFGVTREPGTALAYAAPQDDLVDTGRGRRLSPLVAPPVSTAQATAIYDISARTVYMPNGDKLEAHSGLGEHMDDPRYVHLRMRGATPPHTYTLSMREAPFHGVRALRMNPIGGSGAIHGRTGLLTHSYLLGPNGDSNGCVSFKDYDRFLQAYLRGEVKRLVVVASRG